MLQRHVILGHKLPKRYTPPVETKTYTETSIATSFFAET